MNLTDNLNPMQREAVNHINGPLLILAGAGSGKTRVLTYRIAHLIENGVTPFNILAITFTNKAAGEMRDRVNAIATSGDQVLVCTFHSLCVRILRKEIHKISMDNRFTIYDADDSENLMKRCIKELNIDDKQFPAKRVMSKIGSFKDQLVSPADAAAACADDYGLMKIVKVYDLYQKRLHQNNALDFDDIIFKTITLFRSRPDVLQAYQERFRYIMVDEYQDTNISQYELVRLLSDKHKNLCVVGDDDQSIYGWRGANIRNILEFEKDYKNARVIKLEQNYRSTTTILNAANAVIKRNSARKPKTLWTENSKGCEILSYKADTDLGEAEFIAEKILSHVNDNGKYSDNAVLYRTNSQSRVIEDCLVAKNIPYRLFGGVRFYQRKEIKDILAYLRVINNPKDNISMLRIVNVPRRGLGEATIAKIANYSTENDLPIFDVLGELEYVDGLGNKVKKLTEFAGLIEQLYLFARENNPADIIEKILHDTKYLLELKSSEEDSEDRLENIGELINKAADFVEKSEDKTLAAFLEDVALVADIDNYNENEDAVVLMTLHSSKGLEFKRVFLAGFEEGLFPGYRSIISGDPGELEEERRLCYVGITRAMEELFLTSAIQRRQNGQYVYNTTSRFYGDIPTELFAKPKPSAPAKNSADNLGRSYSKYAGVKKAALNENFGSGAKNYSIPSAIPPPKDKVLDFDVGDKVRQLKYGVGIVTDIKSAGADYEVAVEFPGVGAKKFMAHLSRLQKV